MRIFLSYASERSEIAAPIAFALRGRGHKVFFDKSDLPPGSNYDAQIEAAIQQSSLMIFLISPESLTPGRFTLTELAFAKKKWSSARGHVYPILIAPTPVSEIPAFLSSVHIMHPEGNVAAEVASLIDGLTPIARPLQILPAVLGMAVMSGLLSGIELSPPAMDAMPYLVRETASYLFFELDLYSPGHWQPPYLFAAVIACVLIVWDRVSVLRSLWTFPIIIVAWRVACTVAFLIMIGVSQGEDREVTPEPTQCIAKLPGGGESRDRALLDPQLQASCAEIDKYRKQITPIIKSLNWLAYTVAGLCGGLLGALLTILGLGRLSGRLRPLDVIVLVTFGGTVTGMLLNPRLFIFTELSDARTWLFVAWQTCVAAAIAWQFTRAPRLS